MGKRGRENVRRMNKRPKASSVSSPEGGGGGTSRTAPPGRRAPGMAPSLTPSSTSSGTPSPSQGLPLATGRAQLPPRVAGTPPGTPSSGGSSSSGTAPPPQGVPVPPRGAATPPGTPSSGSSSSSSSRGTPSPFQGVPVAIGTAQLPPRAAATPPATPSSSSSGGGSAGISSPSTKAPPPFLTPRVNPPEPRLQYEKRLAEAEHLLAYMRSNCKDQADLLWNANKWHLKVDFDDLKSYKKQMAYNICNNYHAIDANNFVGGEEYFSSALRTFLLEHFKNKSLDGKFASVEDLKSHIKEHGNLSFTRMPTSIRRFMDIPQKSKIVNLFAGQKYKLEAIESSVIGRQMLCKMVDYMLSNHKKGWCWDGNWSVEDWEVINEKYVNLLAEPIQRVGRENSDKDLNQIAASVLPTFKLNGALPTFMQHLLDELTNLPPKLGDSKFKKDMISDVDYFGCFYTYIKYHPAMMAPLARSSLLQGFYFSMEKLDYKKLSYYKDIAELLWESDWVRAFLPPPSLNRVHFEVFWHNRTPCTDTMPHENTYIGMMGYHRHLMQHSADKGRTQRVMGAYVQSMKDSDEAELMAAKHNETLLPMFMKKLFSLNFMLTKPEFYKYFDAYMATWGR